MLESSNLTLQVKWSNSWYHSVSKYHRCKVVHSFLIACLSGQRAFRMVWEGQYIGSILEGWLQHVTNYPPRQEVHWQIAGRSWSPCTQRQQRALMNSTQSWKKVQSEKYWSCHILAFFSELYCTQSKAAHGCRVSLNIVSMWTVLDWV